MPDPADFIVNCAENREIQFMPNDPAFVHKTKKGGRIHKAVEAIPPAII